MSHNADTSIYLTSKTRMTSEARCRTRSRFFNILVAWYSLWLIAFSIIDLKAASDLQHGTILVILSVFVFALSLIVPALGYDERAVKHRECYLRLQRLGSEEMTDGERNRRYSDILEGYPNHTNIDWDITLVIAKSGGQILSNRSGVIPVTCSKYLRVYDDLVFSLMAGAGLIALPYIILKSIG